MYEIAGLLYEIIRFRDKFAFIYFDCGVKLFDVPPDAVPPVRNTPPKWLSLSPDTEDAPYTIVCDEDVNSGEESRTVAPFTLLGHLYAKRTFPELFLMARYLPCDTVTDDTEA